MGHPGGISGILGGLVEPRLSQTSRAVHGFVGGAIAEPELFPRVRGDRGDAHTLPR